MIATLAFVAFCGALALLNGGAFDSLRIGGTGSRGAGASFDVNGGKRAADRSEDSNNESANAAQASKPSKKYVLHTYTDVAKEISEGYQVEWEVKIGGWVHGNDREMTKAGWEAVGGTGETPDYSHFGPVRGYYASEADSVIAYGVLTARNATPGFSMSDGSPVSFKVYGEVEEFKHRGAFCLEDANGIHYDDGSGNPVQFHFDISEDGDYVFPFAIAAEGGGATPNNGGHDAKLDGSHLRLSAAININKAGSRMEFHEIEPMIIDVTF